VPEQQPIAHAAPADRAGAARADDDQDAESGLARAEWLARRLDKPMGVLGVVFLLIVLGQVLAREDRTVTAFAVAGWALWTVFVAEFVLRAVVAKDRRRFWARNWWQVVFLVVPFLRFARVFSVLRLARVGAVVSAAVRGSRSAGRLLSGRIGWLLAVTAVVVLATSQALFVLGVYRDYAQALHDVALATVTGEPLAAAGGVARVLEVVLAVYSVAVFATLAGALGAFFLAGGSGTGATDGRGAAQSEP
jgi:voltage-gated potassium channel